MAGEKDERAERLAARLRDNLHRRKARARAAEAVSPLPDPGPEPPASADR